MSKDKENEKLQAAEKLIDELAEELRKAEFFIAQSEAGAIPNWQDYDTILDRELNLLARVEERSKK